MIMNFFIWYYASCFAVVYTKTQKYLLLDFVWGIPYNLINCIFMCIINLLVKMILTYKCSYNRVTNFIYKIYFHEIMNIFIEMILEWCIMQYVITNIIDLL